MRSNNESSTKNNRLLIIALFGIVFVFMLSGMTQRIFADEDSVAPVLKSFKIVNTSVTRPGIVKIQLNITEEDSGFSDFDLSLSWNKNGVPQSGNISTGLEYGGAGGDMCSNFQLLIDPSGKQFASYSGIYTFNLYIGESANISDYSITRLWIRDKYGNTNTYENEGISAIAENRVSSFSITGDNSGDDVIPPVLKSCKILDTTVRRPGTVRIQLDVLEGGAGFSDFQLSLNWMKAGTPQSGSISTGLEYGGAGGDMCSNFQFSIAPTGKQFGEKSGVYTFDLKIGEKANIASYTISELWIRDKAGNTTSYAAKDVVILAENGVTTFSVTGNSSNDDVVAPVLNSFQILNPTVNRPGVLKLKINITEEGSGLSDIELSLSWSKNGVSRSGSISTGLEYGGAGGDMCSNFGFGNSNNMKNFGGKSGSYIFTLAIGEKADLSTYTLDRIWLRDKYGNTTEANITNANKFDLKDEFNYSFTTGTNNASLASRLRAMPDGTAAKVEILGNNVLTKECLDAIKGVNKTIVAYSNSVQWVINGSQLTGPTKDINLGVTVSSIRRGDQFAENSDTAYVLSEDSVRLEFYPNGVLPGKMQIRFKSDTLYDKGITGIIPALYYFNGETLVLENQDSDLNFDGTDKWCYVNVAHNSTFIVANTVSLKSVSVKMPKPETAPSATPEPVQAVVNDPDQDSITNIKAPAAIRAKVKKNKVTVTWKKIKKNKKGKKLLKEIKWIEVQFSTDPAFPKDSSVTKIFGKKKAKAVLKLQKKTAYYIRVRYRGKEGVSNWSRVKRVKTK